MIGAYHVARGLVSCLFSVVVYIAAHAAPEGLLPCPSSPNCVSSAALDPKHHVDPFPIAPQGLNSLDILAKIIESFPRTKIIEHTDIYLHAEFRSKIFHFIDDVEFLLQAENRVINVRSASRVGYGDFGVNRRRIERLRSFYLTAIGQ